MEKLVRAAGTAYGFAIGCYVVAIIGFIIAPGATGLPVLISGSIGASLGAICGFFVARGFD